MNKSDKDVIVSNLVNVVSRRISNLKDEESYKSAFEELEQNALAYINEDLPAKFAHAKERVEELKKNIRELRRAKEAVLRDLDNDFQDLFDIDEESLERWKEFGVWRTWHTADNAIGISEIQTFNRNYAEDAIKGTEASEEVDALEAFQSRVEVIVAMATTQNKLRELIHALHVNLGDENDKVSMELLLEIFPEFLERE